MTDIPDRKPDREYTFSLDDEPPSPEQFVETLTAEGFTFERTTDPIKLREPKEAEFNEGKGTITYRQWDHD